ncbi:MAG: winged helix-turn-helix transcriptional regulator [Myxococcales bacterium]|nr:winged helix-turn-helix transcriptional regulator [Myxococcales bacterium]MCB9672930.1 winged helix-turn-helix transcriptional regulator [Alphaproteobacteria bacterium]
MVASPLDQTFAALASPVRREILGRLARGEATVGELVELVHVSQPAVSKHLRVLERAGLVARSPAPEDGRYHRCRIEPAPLREAFGWLGDYQRFWDESLDRLAAYLDELQSREDA